VKRFNHFNYGLGTEEGRETDEIGNVWVRARFDRALREGGHHTLVLAEDCEDCEEIEPLPPFPEDATMSEVGEWIDLMLARGARLAHPDDGWTHPSLSTAEQNLAMRELMLDPSNAGFIEGFIYGFTQTRRPT
jgi:hypothetical protein